MKKRYIIFLLLLWFISLPVVNGQQDIFKWRVGGGTGVIMYYGDLNQRFFAPVQPILDLDAGYLSYQLSAERLLTKGTSLKLSFTSGRFTANDRAIDFKGDLIPSAPDFDRALNSLTLINDLSLSYYLYSDNDRFFGKRAFIAPFLSIGAGVTHFNVYGDLFDAGGDRYFYWSDNSIRTLAETDPLSATALIMTQDGRFETNLSSLETESAYSPYTFSFPVSVGLKIRIGNRMNLNLEYSARYTLTDFLDDVSGNFRTIYDTPLQAYASNPAAISGTMRGNESQLSDIWSYASVTLHYNFGKRKNSYRPPAIYASKREGDLSLATGSTYKPLRVTLSDTARVETPKAVEPILSENLLPKQVVQVDTILIEKAFPADSLVAKSDSIVKPLVLTDTIAVQIKGDSIVNPDSVKIDVDTLILKEKALIVFKEDTTAKPLPQKWNPTDTSFVLSPSYTREADPLLVTPSDQLFGAVKSETPLFMPFNPVEGVIDSVPTRLTREEPSLTPVSGVAQIPTAPATLTTTAPPADNEKLILQERLNMEVEKSNFYRNQVLFMRELMLSMNFKDSVNLVGNTNPIRIDSMPKAPIISPVPAITKTNDTVASRSEVVESYFLTRKMSDADSVNREFARISRDHAREINSLKLKINTLENEMKSLRTAEKTEAVTVNDNVLAEDVPVVPVSTEKVEIPGIEIFFDTGSAILSATAKISLQKIAEFAAIEPDVELVIKGYSDVNGNPDRNMELSMQRAGVVRDFFVAHGVIIERLSVNFFGADLNYPGDLKRYGRRVEVIILK